MVGELYSKMLKCIINIVTENVIPTFITRYQKSKNTRVEKIYEI